MSIGLDRGRSIMRHSLSLPSVEMTSLGMKKVQGIQIFRVEVIKNTLNVKETVLRLLSPQ